MKHAALSESEERLERRYHKFLALFNFAPIGYLTIDRDDIIQDINHLAALRCRMIAADMAMDSEPGKGARLTIRLPCPAQEADR